LDIEELISLHDLGHYFLLLVVESGCIFGELLYDHFLECAGDTCVHIPKQEDHVIVEDGGGGLLAELCLAECVTVDLLQVGDPVAGVLSTVF
jgi:hypothetical protein